MTSYLNKHLPGRNIFANPGPTNVPLSVQYASIAPSMDSRDEDFLANVYQPSLEGLKRVLKTTTAQIFLNSASGHGAWEAVLVNLLSPGDKIFIVESGIFSEAWGGMAKNLGLVPQILPSNQRTGIDVSEINKALLADTAHDVKAICVVHNETSTGVTLPLAEIRKAIDETGHPALFLVDAISSLASIDFRMDEWGVDGVIVGGQKGLMLPVGLSFAAVSPKAWAATERSTSHKHYFSWRVMASRPHKSFVGTPPTHMLFALRESLRLIDAEGGIDAVLARHSRFAEAVRRCTLYWGKGDDGVQKEGAPYIYCTAPERFSDTVTTVVIPGDGKATEVRKTAFQLGVTLGLGISRETSGKAVRLGHIGDNNEASILSLLGVVETALNIAGVPHYPGGVVKAVQYFAQSTAVSATAVEENKVETSAKFNGHAAPAAQKE
ncbi:serine--glyoxylate transaminase [Gonapodya prolifera JEL478]|uniref:alanine--glyoxylate transaminase n=1 Tax=Gonapodya prolifera (strain JEL478) TaxID=1344416 RepID=A0A139AA95_GONPJ|nr:serine--glyoxylate transaminase [Gonapodya prolifera JEL478]|eukprot:KXS13609.1 serine--glyoxylate transaminase [Gonapodya prolifera JEL478]